MEEQHRLGHWLEGRCHQEQLSLRQAAARTGLSHATIRDIRNGVSPSPESIRKLSQAFGGDGNERLALEDHLLTLAGYRTPRPEGEEPTELLAQLIDKAKQLNEPQVKIVGRFADFLLEIDGESIREILEEP